MPDRALPGQRRRLPRLLSRTSADCPLRAGLACRIVSTQRHSADRQLGAGRIFPRKPDEPNAITMASVMIDEIRLRAHARPLEEPGQ
jgi:hypothetical protein